MSLDDDFLVRRLVTKYAFPLQGVCVTSANCEGFGMTFVCCTGPMSEMYGRTLPYMISWPLLIGAYYT